tara:strand:- start:10887 stop:11132 length:246 start_codon:yes stop_codon:yes gene_type:complete
MGNNLYKKRIAILETKIEIFVSERHELLKTIGAAAVLIANLDSSKLSEETCKAAEILSNSLDNIREGSLQEALNEIKPELI